MTLLLVGCALPIIGAPPRPGAGGAPSAAAPAPLPRDREACHRQLSRAGVAFTALPPARAGGIAMPVQLKGRIGGIEVRARSRRQRHERLDCRLALALAAWAPALRAAGVVRLEHYSIYRPGARVGGGAGPVSGHARGLAIDAARFHLADGRVLDVQSDWEGRQRRTRPCPPRPHEEPSSRLLRGVICEAIARGLFHVVLTPHYDRAHADHVHLELKPNTTWTYVR